MIRPPDPEDIAARITREEHAAALARCESSRRSHLGLAEQYRRELDRMTAVSDIAPHRSGAGLVLHVPR